MLKGIKKCILNFIGYFLSKIRSKNKKRHSSSIINSNQEASFGFLLNMYNNINLYNVTFNSSSKRDKLIELEELKKKLNNYSLYGEFDEIQDIKTL